MMFYVYFCGAEKRDGRQIAPARRRKCEFLSVNVSMCVCFSVRVCISKYGVCMCVRARVLPLGMLKKSHASSL